MKKKNCGSNLGQNRAQNYIFCHFLKFGSLVFLYIAFFDSLQKFITSSTGKNPQKQKNWGTKFRPKLGQKLGFLPFSQVCFFSFPLNCVRW